MSDFSPIDEEMLQRAFVCAQQARLSAPPNPWVGCVIAKDDLVIGQGFTQPPGGAHAEVMALRQAQGCTAGSTVYVTLEPCSHYGRTPPCTLALINAKVARVVIGVQDPDHHVDGCGMEQLRAAGIEVVLAPNPQAIERSLAPYLHHRRTGRPFCIAKGAVSIDGRIAARDGTSQWITGDEARRDAHGLRAESQAILVGVGTALADRPQLTVRHAIQQPPVPPLRVVLDATGRLMSPHPLFDVSQAPTLIITTDRCPLETQACWKQQGVEVAVIARGVQGEGVDLTEALDFLGRRGILQVMIEGGATLLGAFLEQKLLQRLCLYMGPCILGSGGLPLFLCEAIQTLKQAPRLNLIEAKILGNSIRIDYGVEDAGTF